MADEEVNNQQQELLQSQQQQQDDIEEEEIQVKFFNFLALFLTSFDSSSYSIFF